MKASVKTDDRLLREYINTIDGIWRVCFYGAISGAVKTALISVLKPDREKETLRTSRNKFTFDILIFLKMTMAKQTFVKTKANC